MKRGLSPLLPQAFDSREIVESSVEAHDAVNAMSFHDCEVKRVARGQPTASQDDRFRPVDSTGVDGKHFVDDSQQRVEGGLDRIAPIDGDVAVKDLLQHLGVGHESCPLGDVSLEQPLRVSLVRMRSSDEVHRNVGVDEDHRSLDSRYPRSISASMP